MKKTNKPMITDFMTKTTYALSEGQETLAKVYQNRFVLIVSVAVLLRGFLLNTVAAVVFALATLVFTEFTYRTRFLTQLTPVEPSDIPQQAVLSKQNRVMNGILYVIFGVLIIYYAWSQGDDYVVCWVLTALGSASLMLAVKYITSPSV